MEKILPLEECSIRQIYLDCTEAKTYMIPIYQRNYAWGVDEIIALIKDVYDSYCKDSAAAYYIGTLVTYKRGDAVYEVIDGQQRLTTIYIIMKALGIKDTMNKLTFSARKVSASTIANIDNYPNLGDEVDDGIRNGYAFATKAINDIIGETDCEREDFKEYFLNKVHIIHYHVPKDVDLNHYFEVMNSRGEQLEKHEIVRSKLSEYLKDNKTDMAKFSRVWEACSKMNIYIQQALPKSEIFGNNLDGFRINDFYEIPKQEESENKATIRELLLNPIGMIEGDTDNERQDKFQPIIDFPNFLLVVLKLTLMKSTEFKSLDFTLDDKELLNEFNKVLKGISKEDGTAFAKLFSFNLLKAKYYLDNFIAHHELSDREISGDNPWKLQHYNQDTNKEKNLTENQDVQKELVHLLSMFEVTFTARQRKNYLLYCLMYLFDDKETVNKEIKAKKYLEFLQQLAQKYFYDVYLDKDSLTGRNQPKPNAFDEALLADGQLKVDYISIKGSDEFNDIYKQGSSDIPLFVFNYTDYILWKKYSDTLRGKETKKDSIERNEFFKELGCSDFGLDTFNNFYFSRTRKSLEHYFPQAKAVKDEDASENFLGISQINCFGNFAMIGANANSSGSNWNPKTKLDHYTDSKSDPISVASLKFKIMMQTCKDNSMQYDEQKRTEGMEWNYEDIKKHQEKMLDIIFNTTESFNI